MAKKRVTKPPTSKELNKIRKDVKNQGGEPTKKQRKRTRKGF